MHIKQVIIEGFKSYRGHIVVEPFDTKHNVIVGNNGAGKSNIFRAIEFVLCTSTSNIVRNARYSIGSNTVPSAFVEVILDNNDAKIPIDSSKVSIRRSINDTKDQYSVNGKNVTRNELANLLEAAGLSMKCPNYLIREEQINQIAISNHSYRLQLLWEAANLSKYDDHFNNMIKCKNQNLDVIAEVRIGLDTLTSHCNNLRIQNDNFVRFTSLEQNIRAVLYFKYQFQKQSYEDDLNTIKQEQNVQERYQQDLLQKLEQSTNVAKTIASSVDGIDRELQTKIRQREVLEDSLLKMHKERKKRELEVINKSQQLVHLNEWQKKGDSDFEKIQKQIYENEFLLKKVIPKYDKIKKQEDDITMKLESHVQKRKLICAKQGRNAHYSSKEERDADIQEKLLLLDAAITEWKESRQISLVHLEDFACTEKRITESIARETQKIEETKAELGDGNMQSMECKIDEANAQIWELQQNEINLILKLNDLKVEYIDININRSSKIRSALMNGCNIVNNITKEGYEDCYKGLVLNNFTCDEKFDRIVENVAGKMLFHHICHNEKTAQRILNKIHEKKVSHIDVSFMPMNELEVPMEECPSHLRNSLLINKLSYADSVKPVMRMIFGTTVLCDEIDEKEVENDNMNYITWNGKSYNSRGDVKFYPEESNSLLSLERRRKIISSEMNSIKNDITQLQGEIKKLKVVIVKLMNSQLNLVKSKTIYDDACLEIRMLNEQLLNNVDLHKLMESFRLKCDTQLNTMNLKREALLAELQQELLSQLSADDQEQLDMLNQQIPHLQQNQKDIISSRTELETEQKRLTNILSRYKKDHEQIASDLEKYLREKNECEADCSSLQSAIMSIEEKIHEIESQILTIDNVIEPMKENLFRRQSELDKWMQRKLTDQKRIADNLMRLNTLLEETSNLYDMIKQTDANITDLATQSRESIERYSNMTENMLDSEMKRINQELKTLPIVNIQAVNKYTKISNDLELHTQSYTESQNNEEKINNVIEAYETRLVKCLQKAFRKMSLSFSDTFKKLVPSGRGELVIIKQDGFEEDFSGEIESEDTAESYTGIDIKVTFNESSYSMVDLMSLSGGQKSLVAVAFVLALHMFDPAPFYLLDEIDHALDTQYRSTLAQVIHELSETTQFITTTHWSEQLRLANQIYGVKCSKSVSSVSLVNRDEARKFVKM